MRANTPPQFGITHDKGFHITFANGVTLSTQFGAGNYCDNRNYDPDSYKRSIEDTFCGNAEIAIWDKDGEWLTKQAYLELFNDEINDDVDGWVDTAKWAQLVAWCIAQ